jgi:transcriptional regulator with XRE-family HTH domain
MKVQSRRPDSTDVLVGRRMRQRRALLGMTQEQLAARLGITFQQVQKYERGTNRISASRLAQLADSLDVPVTYFFQDAETEAAAARALPSSTSAPAEPDDQMSRRETLELVRNYYRIADPKVRRRVRELIRLLSPDAP